MPINLTDLPYPYTFPPSEETPIIRYLDLTKFLSLIVRKELFFSRIDMMPDKFEGKMEKCDIEYYYNWYLEDLNQNPDFQNNDNTKKALELTEQLISSNESERRLILINCWSEYNYENSGLWQIFSNWNTGIAIKSNVKNLIKAFDAESKKLFLSKVNYRNRNEVVKQTSSMLQPFLYKKKEYTFENEIRILLCLPLNGINGKKFNWVEQDYEQGMYLKINIDFLFVEVILAPNCPNWYFELIQDICKKYLIDKPIKRSELS